MKTAFRFTAMLAVLLAITACSGNPHPEDVKTDAEQVFVGLASFYGSEFTGQTTASGDKYNPSAYTAAHRTLPLGTKVLVTNLDNNLSVVVTINDRGPQRADRIIDLSFAAANDLKMIAAGVVKVRIEVVNEKS